MGNKVRKEWEQYVFEDGKECTLEEAVKKAVNAFSFLKDKSARIDINMVLNPEKFEKDFHLSEMEQAKYIQKFNHLGYATHDCATIVKVMDAIYYMFDITKEKAFEMAEYAARNRLTITQTVKDKLSVDFNELVEFEDIVLSGIYDHFAENKVKYDMEEIIRRIFMMIQTLK